LSKASSLKDPDGVDILFEKNVKAIRRRHCKGEDYKCWKYRGRKGRQWARHSHRLTSKYQLQRQLQQRRRPMPIINSANEEEKRI